MNTRNYILRFIRFAAVILLLICGNHAFAIRPAQISSFFSPSSASAGAYFQGTHYRFGGGVVPRGRVIFRSEDGTPIPIGQLNLVRIEKSDSTEDQVAVKWKQTLFVLPINPQLVCPLARFVERNSYIVYTVPVVAEDAKYFRDNGLVEAGGAFIAREFIQFEDFLADVDLETKTEPIADQNVEAKIIADSNGRRRSAGELEGTGDGTYVNADFHVTYQAFLVTKDGKPLVDIAGMPLRYFWEVATDGKAVIQTVQMFQYPSEKSGVQYDAITFFHCAAVFRQFRDAKERGFRTFLAASCQVSPR